MSDRLHDDPRADQVFERELRASQRENHRIKQSAALMTLAMVLLAFSFAFALARVDEMTDEIDTERERGNYWQHEAEDRLGALERTRDVCQRAQPAEGRRRDRDELPLRTALDPSR